MPEMEPYAKAHIPLAVSSFGWPAGWLSTTPSWTGKIHSPENTTQTVIMYDVWWSSRRPNATFFWYALNLGAPDWHFLGQCLKRDHRIKETVYPPPPTGTLILYHHGYL